MDLLVSIIIPVYNAEKYLVRCLESVTKQTYSNIEVILIDDGSTDESAHICDRFVCNDKRFIVIRKENAGPSKAREDGIKLSKGKYIAFVDADDYVEDNMIERLLEVAKQGYDIVQSGYKKVTVNGKLIKSVRLKPLIISGQKECATFYASQKDVTNFLWNKIFRRELFNDIEYPQLYTGEDSCILTQLYVSAKLIINIEDQLYNYVMTPKSLCRQPFSYKRLGNIEAGKFMFNFYSRIFPELISFSALHICSYSARLYCEISVLKIENKEKYLYQLNQTFNDYYKFSRNKSARKRSSIKRKIFIEMFNICPFICKLSNMLYRTIRKI
jgi:glycosyltransferase involved in cell wall biosynthesis